MRFAVILAPVLALAVAGCRPSPAKPVEPKEVRIVKWQSATLMLLAPIESGDCPKGMVVNLALAENLSDSSGAVILPAGMPFIGEVTWSRAAGAISPLINQPARLAIKIRPIVLASGETLRWFVDPESKTPDVHEFTLENVGGAKADPKVESALDDQAKRELLEELARSIESGSAPDDLEAKLRANPAFESLLTELGYSRATEMVQKSGDAAKGFRRLVDVGNSLREGNLTGLGGTEVTLALAALEEAGDLANQITGAVRGIFKGRNIRARIGTKITIVAADDKTLSYPVVPSR